MHNKMFIHKRNISAEQLKNMGELFFSILPGKISIFIEKHRRVLQ